MRGHRSFSPSILVMTVLALAGVTSAQAQGSSFGFQYELSAWVGNTSADSSDEIPYAEDDFTSQFILGELGDGTSFGVGFATTLSNNWVFSIDYFQHETDESSAFDSDPMEPNDCNVNPLQGLIDDCFDNSLFEIETEVSAIDLTAGYQFKFGRTTLTPYFGVRYLDYEQEIMVDFLYPGGFENFIMNENEVSGFGPHGGAKIEVPLGQSKFYFVGDVQLASILSGDRDQMVVDRETVDGSPNRELSASETESVEPFSIDAEVMLGYDFSGGASLALGYSYGMIDVLNTRDTNTGEFSPVTPIMTLQGVNGVGVTDEDYVTHTVRVLFTYGF